MAFFPEPTFVGLFFLAGITWVKYSTWLSPGCQIPWALGLIATRSVDKQVERTGG